MNFLKTFKEPLEKQDYHLFCFFAQLIVILVMFLLSCKFFFSLDKGENQLETQDGFIANVLYDIKTQPGEEKFFRGIPLLNSEPDRIVTTKVFDLEKRGLWLTDKQDMMFTIYLVGIYLANVILVLIGAGPIYKGIRSILAIITMEMLPFFIFVIPFGIWGAIVCTILFIVGIITMFLAPLNLLIHLVLGIIQTAILIRKR